MGDSELATGERADILQMLARHRGFLRYTVDGLTDAQAAERTTPSELCVGGLIKHMGFMERSWCAFAVGGAEAMTSFQLDWSTQFQMLPGETLEDLLKTYEQAAAETDELVARLDLDASHALPEAPWFEPGARWTVRRTFLHILAETAQHSGHADIIREALDGQKTMG